MSLEKTKLIDKQEFESIQDPSWHATLLNGGFSIYKKDEKTVAIYSRKDGKGYVLDTLWTKSDLDLVDEFNKICESFPMFKSFIKEEEDNFDKKIEAWKDAVKKKYPSKASKFKFKSADQGKHISAEIDGEDRSYGVFDIQKGEGVVLESVKNEKEKK
jgi:hypothetical protein